MTKPIIVVKMPCKLLYVIQVKRILKKCSTLSIYSNKAVTIFGGCTIREYQYFIIIIHYVDFRGP